MQVGRAGEDAAYQLLQAMCRGGDEVKWLNEAEEQQQPYDIKVC